MATGNVEGAVYGAFVVGVLFAAEDAAEVGYPETVEAAALVLAVIWLAGFYAHELATRVQRREHINLRLIWRSCLHELTIIEGGLIPFLALLVAWASGASVTVGVAAAVWTTAATIIALEVVAACQPRPGFKRLVLQLSAGIAMGLVIVALKLMLH